VVFQNYFRSKKCERVQVRRIIDLIAGAIEDWFQWMGIEVDDVCILRLELITTVYISIAMQ